MARTMFRTICYEVTKFTCVVAISIFPTITHALTVTSWNIEWLSLTPSNRFEQSKRTDADFQALSRHLKQVSPDILAFQEVDSIAAIQKVVGNEYTIYFSDRALSHNHKHQFNEINQYTGFAIRDTLQVKDLPDFPLTQGNRLRFASAVTLTYKGEKIQLLSVHLKAGCSGKYSSTSSCKQLQRQGKAINNWLKQVEQQGQHYILLGDFNHNLAYRGDWLWAQMINGLTYSPRLTSQSTKASCKVQSNKNPNRTHQFRSLIDHIIVSPSLRTSPAIQNTMQTKDVLSFNMSDHCPISVTLY
ncbi:endonuclease/exonuclease/phosphatase family protein [Vibrio cionasavignyae]|uniref:endonuclease/exonuclease/phosphatase family protein n=1 Tax=Vibrio cionasavignyae TaxID=2910252 RepID=UPI003D0A4192